MSVLRSTHPQLLCVYVLPHHPRSKCHYRVWSNSSFSRCTVFFYVCLFMSGQGIFIWMRLCTLWRYFTDGVVWCVIIISFPVNSISEHHQQAMGRPHGRWENRDPVHSLSLCLGEPQGGPILHPQQACQIGCRYCSPVMASFLPWFLHQCLSCKYWKFFQCQ